MARILKSEEIVQRGCIYCLNSSKKATDILNEKGEVVRTNAHPLQCIIDSCPYRELEKYKKYTEYLQSDDSVCKFDLYSAIRIM